MALELKPEIYTLSVSVGPEYFSIYKWKALPNERSIFALFPKRKVLKLFRPG